jgi:hypothetical protein
LISERIIENQSAVQNPATLKFGTILSASSINKALITSENRPRVTIVSGSVIIFTTGFINIFIIPRTTAKTNELVNVTSAPGRRYAVIIIAIAETNKCVNIFIK